MKAATRWRRGHGSWEVALVPRLLTLAGRSDATHRMDEPVMLSVCAACNRTRGWLAFEPAVDPAAGKL